LKILFPLRERERTFLHSLFEYGTIDAALATDDRSLIEKINAHPLLQWKAVLPLGIQWFLKMGNIEPLD
jgi:hypothetical protein